MKRNRLHTRRTRASSRHERRGSVIVVVLALLTLLSLLGVTFYTFATQEDVSSQYFADAAKATDNRLPADAYFDWALDQLILGPSDKLKHSALYGRKHSLVPNLIGKLDLASGAVTDIHPHSGQGRRMGFHDTDGDGRPDDFDNDGLPDDPRFFPDPLYEYDPNAYPAPRYPFNVLPHQLPRMNFSPAANPNSPNGSDEVNPTGPFANNPFVNYAPDVDYTYPDLNNPFLAYIGRTFDNNGNAVDVVIPSFHRPQYLRQANGDPVQNWWTQPMAPDGSRLAEKVLRPHRQHMNAGSNLPRFLAQTDATGVAPFPINGPQASEGAVNLQQGIWGWDGTNAVPPIEYDVDNDGDGIKEGVYLDLDFPIQTLPLPDGRHFIPIFSYTVLDADAKLNVNAHGQINNTNKDLPSQQNPDDVIAASGGANPRFLSKSNQGLSPAEVNLGRALYADASNSAFVNQTQADLDAALEQIRQFYQADPLSSPNPALATANMELAFLLWGRVQFDANGNPDDKLGGRWMGKNSNLEDVHTAWTAWRQGQQAVFPQPGVPFLGSNAAQADDNRDMHVSQASRSGLLTPGNPAFVHPLDIRGSGNSLFVPGTGNTGARRLLMKDANLNLGLDPAPAQAVVYGRGYQNPFVVTSTNPFPAIPYLNSGNGTSGSLHRQPSNWLIDDPDEMLLDRANTAAVNKDGMFTPDEMAALQLGDTDYARIGGGSRLRRLLPFNFELNNEATAIRRQFTTDSWDRLQFNARPSVKRPTEWTDTNNPPDGIGDIFPPRFGTVQPFSSNDPFRPLVRQLFWTQRNGTNQAAQRRLDINRLFMRDRQQHDQKGEYRDLTPHPPFDSASPGTRTPVPAMIHANDGQPAFTYPPQTQIAREWWARYDRQRLARDIYVLLYLLGGGNDAKDYTTSNTTNQLYSDEQLHEMAQFAVNYVDALDRDNVITRFEYDPDLSDGWDPSPYGTTGAAPSTLRVVYGVETHALSFSEALALHVPQLDDNHTLTLFSDEQREHVFLYVELQNASPFDIPLDKGTWRIRRVDGAVQDAVVLRDATAPLRAGETYTIGASLGVPAPQPPGPNGEQQYRPSDFRLAIDSSLNPPRFEKIVPRPPADPGDVVPGSPNRFESPTQMPDASASYLPATNLDLTYNDHWQGANPRFSFEDPTGQPLLQADPPGESFLMGLTGGDSVTLVLERRRNLEQPRLTDTDPTGTNPQGLSEWIEVDRISAEVRTFELEEGDSAEEMRAKLQQNELRSFERPEALTRNATNVYNGPAGIYQHTIGPTQAVRVNSRTDPANPPTLWQPHFNRDYASVLELLSTPLYGPGFPEWDTTGALYTRLLDRLGDNNEPSKFNEFIDGTTGLANVAFGKFLRPRPDPATTPDAQNRWYRLFEFLEAPSRSHRIVNNKQRIPGRINLNTIRDQQVLAALIDDEHHLNFFNTADKLEPADRNWWQQLLAARDQYDPETGYYLPGLPSSRPFRSLAHVDDGRHSLEHTLLRDLPMDTPPFPTAVTENRRRNLFEARTQSDTTPANNPRNHVDYHTRQRLLSKVSNLSTNRSNVFYVWITVEFFEVSFGSGAPQIGAKMPDLPGYRGFFLVDRTLLEQAAQTKTQNGVTMTTFDFRSFVTYRKQL